MKTKIFLTGFRGSGKTTLAKLLAKKLNPVRNFRVNALGISLESKISKGVNFELIEMDKLIIKRAGKSIAEMTKNGKNWHQFRSLENKTLKEIIKKENIIVDTGGGLFVNDVKFSEKVTFGEYNFNLVKNLPGKLIIFLKVNDEVLKKRLKKEEFRNFRPPLTGKNGIEEEIKIYHQRLPLYEKRADFIIDNSSQTPKESLKEISSLMFNMAD